MSNIFPTLPSRGVRLAIVAPNPKELSGSAGKLLAGALNQNGVSLSSCFQGFISQSDPEDKGYFDMRGWEVTSGLDLLKKDLEAFSPNCILLLGEPALRACEIYHAIHFFRGSIFKGLFDYKCVATHLPNYIFRDWDSSPLFMFDVQRACAQAEYPEIRVVKRITRTVMSAQDCIDALRSIKPGTLCSIDIEGGIPNPNEKEAKYRFLNAVTCIGISTSPEEGFIIPVNEFSPDLRIQVMAAFAEVMSDPAIPKVLQNGLYDWFVLVWVWKIQIKNLHHDTMLSGWELYPELPKGLGTQASIYTEEPYYKFERGIEDKQTHYAYCVKDACVTLEIAQKHEALFTPAQREHFRFNMSLIPALQFMMLKGIRYDSAAVKVRKKEVELQMAELQAACNLHASQEININSPKQMTELLYRKLRCEPVYAIDPKTRAKRLTANADAMLQLIVKQGSNFHPFLMTALIWKKYEGCRKQLELTTDPDGRVRCSYNLVGTDTGRLSCQGSNTGSGTNLQTIMEVNRCFYLPDEDHYFFQCDLSGADGWTVAVHCMELGDPTMMDDYLAGLKPAKIIAAMHSVGSGINKLSRPELKAKIKELEAAGLISDDVYAASKAVQHGSNYDMQPKRMSENILEKSFKKSIDHKILWVPPQLCKLLQTYYFLRYPGIKLWHEWVKYEIDTKQCLPSASGHVRTFFGRARDNATYRLAYAHEPQHNTTYATNLAMQRLWTDPDNRTSDGSLIIQPLHSVHDALCGQFPADRAEWAASKIRSYFQNPIRIRNTEITIPFEGGYGQSWFHTKEKYAIGHI